MSLVSVILLLLGVILLFFDLNKSFKELRSKFWKTVLVIVTVLSFILSAIDQNNHLNYEKSLNVKTDTINRKTKFIEYQNEIIRAKQDTIDKKTEFIKYQNELIGAKQDTILIHQTRQSLLTELSNEIAKRELILRMSEDSINLLKESTKFKYVSDLSFTNDNVVFNFTFTNVGNHTAENINIELYVINSNITYFDFHRRHHINVVPTGRILVKTSPIEKKYLTNYAVIVVQLNYTDFVTKVTDSLLIPGYYRFTSKSESRMLYMLENYDYFKAKNAKDSLLSIGKFSIQN